MSVNMRGVSVMIPVRAIFVVLSLLLLLDMGSTQNIRSPPVPTHLSANRQHVTNVHRAHHAAGMNNNTSSMPHHNHNGTHHIRNNNSTGHAKHEHHHDTAATTDTKVPAAPATKEDKAVTAPVTPPRLYPIAQPDPNNPRHPMVPPALIPFHLGNYNNPQPYNVTLKRDFDRKGGYWHVVNPHIERSLKVDPQLCKQYDEMHNNINLTSVINRYKLWSDMIGDKRMKKITPNDTIYGMEAALDIIWKHQHPADCTNQKFLINGEHGGGMGSEIHVVINIMGLAMDLDRVFILNPISDPTPRWQYEVEFCQQQKTKHGYMGMDCYFEAVSNCTVYDALGGKALDLLSKLTSRGGYHPSGAKDIYAPQLKAHQQIDAIYYDDRALQAFQQQSHEYRVVFLKNVQGFGCGRYVPRKLLPIAGCSPIIMQFHYYWWRALTATYLMRPNEETSSWLEAHRMKEYESFRDKPDTEVVSIYLRRGDKGKEMRIAEYDEYVDGIRLLKDLGFLSAKTNKALFFGTEAQRTINDIQLIVNKSEHLQDFKLYYTNVFPREGLFAGMDEGERNNALAKGLPIVKEPQEYLSALLNIYYLVQADAWVCTLGSNFCRLVDELRATIGGRGGLPYIDLSVEKCYQVPCLYGGLIDLDWR